MSRLFVTLGILSAIIGATIWEQVFLETTYKDLESQLLTVKAAVMDSPEEGVDTEENIALIGKLYDTWRDKEQTLCYLVKHIETFQVSDSIIYAKNFIEFNNKEEAMTALSKLQYLFETRRYNIGTSIQNII
jgi:aromatic ring hydroxylase